MTDLPKRSTVTSSTPQTGLRDKPEGDTVTVTWGEELFTPVSFNSFRVGPFTSTTQVRPGETRVGAMARVMTDLEHIAGLEYEAKLVVYLDRLRKMGELVGKR